MRKHKLPMIGTPLEEMKKRAIREAARSLKDKQESNGRTLALDGAAWRKLRALVLSEKPLCEHCERRGWIVQATDVDHKDNDPSNNDRDNLASLCHSCHSHKTMASMGCNVYMGCDLNGMPLDPDHPWNREAK